jgi:hypothetical protein
MAEQDPLAGAVTSRVRRAGGGQTLFDVAAYLWEEIRAQATGFSGGTRARTGLRLAEADILALSAVRRRAAPGDGELMADFLSRLAEPLPGNGRRRADRAAVRDRSRSGQDWRGGGRPVRRRPCGTHPSRHGLRRSTASARARWCGTGGADGSSRKRRHPRTTGTDPARSIAALRPRSPGPPTRHRSMHRLNIATVPWPVSLSRRAGQAAPCRQRATRQPPESAQCPCPRAPWRTRRPATPATPSSRSHPAASLRPRSSASPSAGSRCARWRRSYCRATRARAGQPTVPEVPPAGNGTMSNFLAIATVTATPAAQSSDPGRRRGNGPPRPSEAPRMARAPGLDLYLTRSRRTRPGATTICRRDAPTEAWSSDRRWRSTFTTARLPRRRKRAQPQRLLRNAARAFMRLP